MSVNNITKQLIKYNIPYNVEWVDIVTFAGYKAKVKKAIVTKSHVVELLSIVESLDHKDSDGKDISRKRNTMIKSLYKFMENM